MHYYRVVYTYRRCGLAVNQNSENQKFRTYNLQTRDDELFILRR